MKKTINKETHICDKCGKDAGSYPETCICCGQEFCYGCAKTKGVEYPHAVSFSGSGDGFYCNPCNLRLAQSGEDKLHNAYVAIQLLRAESEAFYKGFRIRSEAAEKEVARLNDKRN